MILTNFTASIPDGAPAWPLREVKRKGIFASWRIFARRVDVFPVPPVRRIAILVLVMFEIMMGILCSRILNCCEILYVIDVIKTRFQYFLYTHVVSQETTPSLLANGHKIARVRYQTSQIGKNAKRWSPYVRTLPYWESLVSRCFKLGLKMERTAHGLITGWGKVRR